MQVEMEALKALLMLGNKTAGSLGHGKNSSGSNTGKGSCLGN
jgi:hypothetical protein